MYTIDFNIFATQLIPTFLRKSKITAFIQVLISPIVALYNEFISFRSLQKNRIHHTGQVIYFEKILNDTFDPVNRGISISDGVRINPVILYNNIESQAYPVYIYNSSEDHPNYVYNLGEFNSQYDFIINLPAIIYNQIDVPYLIATVELYKLAGKRYQIQTY